MNNRRIIRTTAAADTIEEANKRMAMLRDMRKAPKLTSFTNEAGKTFYTISYNLY